MSPSHGVNVPGGETDPLWYMAAHHLAPKTLGSTARRGWVEGFVAALEYVRGENAILEGLADILRETVQKDPRITPV